MIKILLLLGKSCSGKTTIQRELAKLGLSPIVTYTTRPKREKEINGVTYNFISEDDFYLLKEKGFFATTSSYNVANGETWMYGTAIKDLADNKVIIINPKEFNDLYNLCLENICPVSYYINTSENVIWNRLLKRKDDINEAQRRIISDREDFYGIEQKVDFVLRNDGELKISTLADMIKYSYDKCLKKGGFGI